MKVLEQKKELTGMQQFRFQWMKHYQQCQLTLVVDHFSFTMSKGLKDKVGEFDTELVEEFFQAFVSHAKVTLHINLQYGKNSHHIIESIFKAFGRALNAASTINPNVKGIPSTKGML